MSAFSRYLNNDYEVSLQFGVPPCPICAKIIKDSDKAVQCYKNCKRWFHKECINMRFSVYMKYEDKVKLRWSCERIECKGSEPEDEFEEWAAMKGAELLSPGRRVHIPPESQIYPAFIHDEELLPAKDKVEQKVEETTEPQKPTKDKELLSTVQPHMARETQNELVETYNRRFGKKETKGKKKREVGLSISTIKNMFMKSRELDKQKK